MGHRSKSWCGCFTSTQAWFARALKLPTPSRVISGSRYRAQYFVGTANGEAADVYAIGVLTPKLLSLLAANREWSDRRIMLVLARAWTI